MLMTPENSQHGTAESPPAAPETPVGMDQRLLTTKELMSFLNLSRTKIWELVKKENLPAFKLGGDYRYRQSEVIVWLENYRVAQTNDDNATSGK